jgi:DNA-binding MarR family transcriptional regulator
MDCAGEILDTVPLLMRQMRAQIRTFGARNLTLVEFRSLAFVARTDGATLSGLTDHIGLSMPSMSKIVDSLVKQKLMRRDISPADRRCMSLSLTERGRSLHLAARAHTKQYLVGQLAMLGAVQRESVAVALRLLRELFNDIAEKKTSKEPARRTPRVLVVPTRKSA